MFQQPKPSSARSDSSLTRSSESPAISDDSASAPSTSRQLRPRAYASFNLGRANSDAGGDAADSMSVDGDVTSRRRVRPVKRRRSGSGDLAGKGKGKGKGKGRGKGTRKSTEKRARVDEDSGSGDAGSDADHARFSTQLATPDVSGRRTSPATPPETPTPMSITPSQSTATLFATPRPARTGGLARMLRSADALHPVSGSMAAPPPLPQRSLSPTQRRRRLSVQDSSASDSEREIGVMSQSTFPPTPPPLTQPSQRAPSRKAGSRPTSPHSTRSNSQPAPSGHPPQASNTSLPRSKAPPATATAPSSQGSGSAPQSTGRTSDKASTRQTPLQPLSSYCCPICFCPPVNATLTPCGHIACGACLFKAVKAGVARGTLTAPEGEEGDPKCPVCRATIPGWDGRGGGVIGLKARAVFSL